MKSLSARFISISFFLCLTAVLAAKEDNLAYSIVPRPQSVMMHKKSPVPTKNFFRVKGAVVNFDAALDYRSKEAIAMFATKLTVVSGKTSSTASPIGLEAAAKQGLAKGFAFYKDSTMEEEEYMIDINDKSACICAGGYNGILYAIQTLRQMLPADIYGKTLNEQDSWILPCVTIKDKPRFSYRGIHLDCSRHFFSTDEIKRILDIMAVFKLNRFHWHLSDDQGWRIEIKSHPELTQIGAFRDGTQIGHDRNSSDGVRYGGFYTQEQITDVISYAYKLGIEVIPEIDLPGHMQAALATYPELGCTGGPYEVWTNWGISNQVLCAGKDATYHFISDVLDEVCDLFPYEYVHIGGDECSKTEWEKCPDCQRKINNLGFVDDEHSTAEQKLQTFMIQGIQKFLQSKRKTMIGWDEIREGGSTGDAVIMAWRGMEIAKEALESGSRVILTPTSHFYFDYAQSEETDLEPVAAKHVIPLEKVYSFDPFDGGCILYKDQILGIQANLWTEFISSDKGLEYMLLPRLTALSEVQWSDSKDKNYELFKKNLIEHEFIVFEKLGYTYSRVIAGEHGYTE